MAVIAPVWCVKHAAGWCATATGQDFPEGASNVPTACGYYVTLPYGAEQRVPDCAGCMHVLLRDPATVLPALQRATAQLWALRALAAWDEDMPPTPRELANDDARRRHVRIQIRTTSDAERMAAALAGLARRHLAVRVGVAGGGRTWALTGLGERVAALVADNG